jgi:hypothetical protein
MSEEKFLRAYPAQPLIESSVRSGIFVAQDKRESASAQSWVQHQKIINSIPKGSRGPQARARQHLPATQYCPQNSLQFSRLFTSFHSTPPPLFSTAWIRNPHSPIFFKLTRSKPFQGVPNRSNPFSEKKDCLFFCWEPPLPIRRSQAAATGRSPLCGLCVSVVTSNRKSKESHRNRTATHQKSERHVYRPVQFKTRLF